MRIAVVDDSARDRLWLAGELKSLLARRRLEGTVVAFAGGEAFLDVYVGTTKERGLESIQIKPNSALLEHLLCYTTIVNSKLPLSMLIWERQKAMLQNPKRRAGL